MWQSIFVTALAAAACLSLAGALALSIAFVADGLRMPHRRGARLEVFTRIARWIVAAMLAASGGWAMIAPRSDQPALDALEKTFPAVRAAYMGRQAAAGADNAEVRAAREANRWGIGLAFLVLAASFLVSLPQRESVQRS